MSEKLGAHKKTEQFGENQTDAYAVYAQTQHLDEHLAVQNMHCDAHNIEPVDRLLLVMDYEDLLNQVMVGEQVTLHTQLSQHQIHVV